VGTQHLVFKFLQFRRDEAFGILEGLASDIVGGHGLGLGTAYFNVVAVNAVVTDFEGGLSAALALAGLQSQQEVARIAAQVAEFVQLAVVAVGNVVALA